MLKHELTGNTRLRPLSRLFRKPLMVLQVEVREHGTLCGIYDNSHQIDRTYWTDARVEDVAYSPKILPPTGNEQ